MENKNYRSRYLKVEVFNSTNDISRIESTVNHTVDSLKDAHAKIVSITTNIYGISPMNLLYNIIYEADHAISDAELAGKGK